ncbi:hypothetical protein [Halanaerobaculum tunisiense]
MNHNQITFQKNIRNQTGEFIVVLIKSGANCCKHKGVLCNVGKDFLVLINNGVKIEIALDAVVAVKRKINGTKSENSSCYYD